MHRRLQLNVSQELAENNLLSLQFLWRPHQCAPPEYGCLRLSNRMTKWLEQQWFLPLQRLLFSESFFCLSVLVS
jgi:hypothetical protein